MISSIFVSFQMMTSSSFSSGYREVPEIWRSFVRNKNQIWLLWQQSQGLGVQPSVILGLTQGSYEAYCLDQAIWYFGSTIQNDLSNAGHKKSKREGQIEAARKKVLHKYLGGDQFAPRYADPAALFSQMQQE